MKYIIKDFSKEYSASIVKLHKAGISTGFLSTLPEYFLRHLYKAIAVNKSSRLLIAVDNLTNSCIGFIAGTLNTKAMYIRLIINHGFVYFIFLMGTLYRITTVKKIVETLFYPFISQKNNNPHVQKYLNIRPVEAELLAIAVDNRMRGQGVGKSLVKAFEKYLNHNGVNDYKVVTFNKDTSSNLFYKALGFVENRNFLHHGNTMNEYVKKITPDQNHNE